MLVNIGAYLSFFTASVVLAAGVFARIRDESAPLTQLELILCALLGLCCSVSLMSWGSTLFDDNASPSGFATAVQFIFGLFAGLVLVPGLAIHARPPGARWPHFTLN